MEPYDEETVAKQAEYIEDLKKEIRHLQERIKNLENSNTNAEDTVAVAQDHYTESQAKLKALEEKRRNETKSLREKAREARAELKDCKDQLRKEKEAFGKLTKERDDLEAELEDLKSATGTHGKTVLQLLTTRRVLDVKTSDNNAKDATIAELTRKIEFMGSKFITMTQEINAIRDQLDNPPEESGPATPKIVAASIASSEEPSPSSLASELAQAGSDSDSDRAPSPDDHADEHVDNSGSDDFVASFSPIVAVKPALPSPFATAPSITASPSAAASSKAASSWADDNEDNITDTFTTVDESEQAADGPSTPNLTPKKNGKAETTSPRTPTTDTSPIPNEFGSPQARRMRAHQRNQQIHKSLHDLLSPISEQSPLNTNLDDPFRTPVSHNHQHQQLHHPPQPPTDQPVQPAPGSANLVDPAVYESLFRPVTPPYGLPDYREGRWDPLYDGNLALMHGRGGVPDRLLPMWQAPAGTAFVEDFDVDFMKQHYPAGGPYDARSCISMFPAERHERLALYWENVRLERERREVGDEKAAVERRMAGVEEELRRCVEGRPGEAERLRVERLQRENEELVRRVAALGEQLGREGAERRRVGDAAQQGDGEASGEDDDDDDEKEQLRAENAAVRSDNVLLRAENSALRRDNGELKEEELRTVRGPTVEIKPEPAKLAFRARPIPGGQQQQPQQSASSGLERMLERTLKGIKTAFRSVPCDRYHVFPWAFVVFLLTLLALFYFAAAAEQERAWWLAANDATALNSIMYGNSRYGARVGAPLPRTVFEPAENLTLGVEWVHPWFRWGDGVPLQVVQGAEVVVAKLTGRR